MSHKYPALVLALLGSALTAQAQDAARAPQLQRGADGLPELVQFRPGTSPKLADAQKALQATLALAPETEMRPLRREVDALGITHEKFQQYYKGVKVEHASYSVHARNGAIEAMSGDAEQLSLDVRPGLSADAARQAALGFVRARKYMWEDAREEAGLKQAENNPGASYFPQGELVIVRNQLSMDAAKNGQPTLAWKFNVYAQEPLSRAHIYVDARSGEIVFVDAIIKHAAATGTLATRYSGTQSTTTDSYNGSYRLRDVSRGSGILTYNCRKSNSYTNAVDFTDADNSWTEYNNANKDNAALDAHWGAQGTFDYFKNVHGRNSYNNAGAAIRSYVHFDDTPGDGRGYENAFWDGSRMTYGDGYSRFDALTSLDVAAHEIGHAVCTYTANLTYSYESGALNEGFSDIWGAAVEYYKAPTKSTWLIGEDIDNVRPSLRSMSNPNAEGQPDTYKGTYWYTGSGDYGGVHTNSGVLNHWFYRLAVGGSGTNDIGSSFSVTGIGIDAAAKIAYRTESVYLTASSNYAAARTYSIQSAKDLYGAGSAQEIAVTNAWYAVGVGAAYGGGGTPTTPTYCASKGSNVSYEWIDLVQLGSINRSSGKDAGYYNGTALSTTLPAGSSQTIYYSAGFTSTAYTEYFKVYIDYNQDGDFADAGELVASRSSSASTTLSSVFTVPATAKNGATRLRVVMSDNSATTSCNSYSYGETEDYTVNVTGGAAFAPAGVASLTGTSPSLDGAQLERRAEVYPNPASNLLSVVLPDQAPLKSVRVYDVRGAEVKQAALAEDGRVDVSRLAPGIYQLSVSDGQKSFHSRFVKQ
ncbi:M4 family metallopeptidase [Hymenobacter sp. B81]|uniref:M4 family metallopeptidase n=1 Tax=Hymenobacter sp. B81 TaxID=3344878 RepID=UPI0037DD9865